MMIGQGGGFKQDRLRPHFPVALDGGDLRHLSSMWAQAAARRPSAGRDA